MNTSNDIDQVSAALAKAQGEIESAKKDSNNPYFKSKYADLAAVWSAIREALSKHGLAVIQTPRSEYGDFVTRKVRIERQDKQGYDIKEITEREATVSVVTRLVHGSGQWIEDTLTMLPLKSDPQAIGSAITYARRYALAAIAGVAQDDDDSNAASGNKPSGNDQKSQYSNYNKTSGHNNQKQEPAKETAKEPAKTPAANTDQTKTNSQANTPAAKTPSGKDHSGHVWTLEEVNNVVTPELVAEANRIKAKGGFVRESFNKHDGDQAAILNEWKLIPTPQAQKAA